MGRDATKAAGNPWYQARKKAAEYDDRLPKGTRICQFRLVKQDEPVEFEVVEDLGNPNRGGWGSTGTGKEAQ